jgi:hypothetical protein
MLHTSALNHLVYLDLRHDFFRACAGVTLCSFVANILPKDELFEGHPKIRSVYCMFVDLIAAFALNWRMHTASLNLRIFSFRQGPGVFTLTYRWIKSLL